MTKTKFQKEVEKIKSGGSVLVALQRAQETYGHITKDAVAVIADVFGVSRSSVYSVATFYHQFTFAPKGKNEIKICMGTACYVLGADTILRAIEDDLGIRAGGVTPDGQFSIEHNTRCVGDCANAPIVIINDKWYPKTTARKILLEIKKLRRAQEQPN